MAVCLYVYLNVRSSTSKPPNLFFQNINYLNQTCILDENISARDYFEMLENQPILIKKPKISFKCTKTALRICIILKSKISFFTVKSCLGIKKGVLRSKVQIIRKKDQ